MLLNVLKAKLHRLKITHCDINYEGSIFVDRTLLERANILAYEKVDIYNITNGQRFSTYAVPIDDAGIAQINGAAARLVHPGDLVIVCSYCILAPEEAKNHKPHVVLC